MSILIGTAISFGAEDSMRRKARYYYLEGALKEAEGNHAEAYEYFKKAFETDSTYTDAAYSYGSQRLLLRSEAMQGEEALLKSLAMMQAYVDENPSDLFAGRFYGYVTSRLDTVDEAIRVYERMIRYLPKETYLQLNLADAYMMKGRNDKALEALGQFEAVEGKSQEISTKKMTLMLADGDTLGSIKEVDSLLATNPENPFYLILKGNLYEVIGNNDSTFYCYSRAETLNPDNGAVKMALATYYVNRGDSVRYDEKLYEALITEDLELEDKLDILSQYLQTLINEKGETARGDYLFTVLKEQYPHEPQVLDLSARYNGAKGDFRKASEEISYAIDQDPANIDFWGMLMRYQFADSLPGKVAETYLRAQEHIEVPEGMTLIYAAALTESGDYEGAEEAYASLVHKINPDLPIEGRLSDQKLRQKLNYENLVRLSAYYNMIGDTFYKENEIEKAFDSYENSLFFYESNALTLNNYAYFLAETGGDLEKAGEMSHRAIMEQQDNPTFLDTYAWILFKKKEYAEALDYITLALEKAKAEGDENAEYYHHYGDILFMNHQPQEALENWEKALHLDPDNELIKKKVTHKTFFFE